MGGLPGRVVVRDERSVKVDLARPRRAWGVRMRAKKGVDLRIGFKQCTVGVQDLVFKLKTMEIQLSLSAQGFAGLGHLAVMVDGLDRLLKADGDEQSDTDGGDVDKEVFPGVGGFVGRVHVEHGESSIVGGARLAVLWGDLVHPDEDEAGVQGGFFEVADSNQELVKLLRGEGRWIGVEVDEGAQVVLGVEELV